MQLHEFELRYRAYKGLNYKFDLGWDDQTLLEMTKISIQGTLKKPVQETDPQELHEVTLETYTPFKKDHLAQNSISTSKIRKEKKLSNMLLRNMVRTK